MEVSSTIDDAKLSSKSTFLSKLLYMMKMFNRFRWVETYV
jgi:hypothetical protein